MACTITTDNKWRDLTCRHDVPRAVLDGQFDYQNEEETLDGFFKYRGAWYHLDMFTRTDMFDGWHGYHSDSAFSGVLIKLSSDGERVKLATYTS